MATGLNQIEKWKKNSDLLTPEEVLEEDIGIEEIRKELNQYPEKKRVSFLLQILGRDAQHNKENSKGDRLTQAVCKSVSLRRANEHYKKRIEKLQEKLRDSEA
jgi:hypothetical protein